MDRADRLIGPLFSMMGQGQLKAARELLNKGLRDFPKDPRLQAARLDLPIMHAAQLAHSGGPIAEGEGEILDEAYDAAATALRSAHVSAATKRMAVTLLLRLGGGHEVDRLGSFAEVGREWAAAGRHGMLLQQLARVASTADRLELIEQHRLAARALEAEAAGNPIRQPPRDVAPERMRIGFLSADLRGHVVGAFALPLFEHVNRERVELFCYSNFSGPPDVVEQFIRSRSTFREIARLSDREAAQLVADDRLDALIDLGASTGQNRLAILAYKPAPVQVSWLGYPHSTGLSTVDYIVVDPYLRPPTPDLLAETPLLLPDCWVSLARLQFSQETPIEPLPPQERGRSVTFGTANQPNKYSPAVFATWSRVLTAVPGSTFLFVRPEAASSRFRDNMVAAFAKHGVASDRLRFDAVRGGHLASYNDIDVALDTFPLKGGTTTCESLWMGVPTVSLMGPALFERLSLSLLANCGLGDLCADDEDGFISKAVALSADLPRLRGLRQGLRKQIAASPIGNGAHFAANFFNLITSAAANPPGRSA